MDNFLGEIRIFAGVYAPQDWALCNGQLLPIQQNSTLFALIGTTYGGDGVNNFALPDFRGRIPIGQGLGAGLSQRVMGQNGGTETVTLTENQLPAHNHSLFASPDIANSVTPGPTMMLGATAPSAGFYQSSTATSAQSQTAEPIACTSTGGNLPHSNMMPTLCVSFIIALVGNYPTQQ